MFQASSTVTVAKIILERPKLSTSFVGGETIRGKFVVDVLKTIEDVKEIFVSLKMVENVDFPAVSAAGLDGNDDDDDDGDSINQRKKGHVTHFDEKIVLFNAPVLPVGSYTYEFSYLLPKNVPSTVVFPYGAIECFVSGTVESEKGGKLQFVEVPVKVLEFVPPDILQKWPEEVRHTQKSFTLGGSADITLTVPAGGGLLTVGGKIPLFLKCISGRKVQVLFMNLIQKTVYESDDGVKREYVDLLYDGVGHPQGGMEKNMRAAIKCPIEAIPSRSARGLDGELSAAINRSKGEAESERHEGPNLCVSVEHYVDFRLEFGALTKEARFQIPITLISPEQHAIAEGKVILTNHHSSVHSATSPTSSSATSINPAAAGAGGGSGGNSTARTSATRGKSVHGSIANTDLIDLTFDFTAPPAPANFQQQQRGIAVNNGSSNNLASFRIPPPPAPKARMTTTFPNVATTTPSPAPSVVPYANTQRTSFHGLVPTQPLQPTYPQVYPQQFQQQFQQQQQQQQFQQQPQPQQQQQQQQQYFNSSYVPNYNVNLNLRK